MDQICVFLINIGYILVVEDVDKMLIYRSKSLSKKAKERLTKMIKKIMNFKDPAISDFCDDETEKDTKRVNELLKKLKRLEKEKSKGQTTA